MANDTGNFGSLQVKLFLHTYHFSRSSRLHIFFPNTKPGETSRALKGSKNEAAGSFTLLMSSE